MKDILNNSVVKMIAALAIVGAVSGMSLVFVYNYAMPKIEINIKNETGKAIRNIFPEASLIDEIEEKKLYKISDKESTVLGYAFLAQGNGYQGVIKIIGGVDNAVTVIKGIEILESQETPGLGAEIADKKFRKQFEDLSVEHKIEYLKNQKPQKPYQIEAITGATISSRAVVSILNKRISQIREYLKVQ